MWFKDPVRMAELRGGAFKGDREKFIRTWLFSSCQTGTRLRRAFGEDLCDEIVWEETSRKMGGYSASAYPAEPEHMLAVIKRHNPDLVITFGKVAQRGLAEAYGMIAIPFNLIEAPHPAARHKTVFQELDAAAARVREIMAT